MRQLLAPNRPVEAQPDRTRLEIQVSPRVVTSGRDVIVTCLIPPVYAGGAVEVAVEMHGSSAKRIDSISYRRVFGPMACGTWMAACTVETRAHQMMSVREPIEVIGGMCGGDTRDRTSVPDLQATAP